MVTDIRPGSTILLIRSADGTPVREQAHVATADGTHVTVSLEQQHNWSLREPAALVRTESGARWAAPAVCSRQVGPQVTFELLREWQPTNRRNSPRFETRLSAEVRSRRGYPPATGRLLDISESGARVLLNRVPDPEGTSLVITALGQKTDIPCRVVETSLSENSYETRLSFKYVFPQDQSLLASILELMSDLQEQGRNLLTR